MTPLPAARPVHGGSEHPAATPENFSALVVISRKDGAW